MHAATRSADARAFARNTWAVRWALCCMLGMLVWANACAAANDPLPSWNDGTTKQQIQSFVKKITTTGSPDFVEPAKRIAVFDNDGTLWAEQPAYFEFFFALDQVKAMSPSIRNGKPPSRSSRPWRAI